MSGSADELRVGIVGAGTRGRLFTTAISQHGAARVVAVCDREASLAASVAEPVGAQHFTDYHRLLNASLDLDAMVIATPDFAHRAVAVDAAAAGLHLLIEKPLATSVADALAIRDAVVLSGVRCMVAFENRWNPRFRVAKQLIDDGKLGSLLHQVIHLNDTIFVPTSMLPWAAASSPAWFLMPHSLDLALWLSGVEPETVFASGVRKHLSARGIDTWDAVDAVIRLTDGTSVTLHSAWVLPESFPAIYDFRYEAVGTHSALRVEGADQGVHQFGDRTTWPQWGVYQAASVLKGFPVDMVLDFVDHARGEHVAVPSIEEGLRVTRVIAAVHESLRTGSVINI